MSKENTINAAQCTKCGDCIRSTHRHDFRYCKCGQIAVDGGNDYRRRLFRERDDVREIFTEEEFRALSLRGSCGDIP